MKKHGSRIVNRGLSLAALAALSACTEMPPMAYINRGDPEMLLDVSSEVVNMNLSSPASVARLSAIVQEDPPARAELGCALSDALCSRAKKLLDDNNVPVDMTGGGGVALVYERVIARDCQNRFIDNSINPYNLHHPTFGCSIMGNMVQQVSDKRQFVSPALMDFQDGEKAAQNYGKYLEPSAAAPQSAGGNSDGYLTNSGTAGSVVNSISK